MRPIRAPNASSSWSLLPCRPMLKTARSVPGAPRALFYAIAALCGAATAAEPVLPRPGFLQTQPAAIEVSWSPLRLPTGQKSALAGTSYLVAMDEEWGLGPSFYGAAKGSFGGLFTVGFTAQRRWRLAHDLHAAASLYAGAGGGLSSDKLRFGGGLMIRPELSLRREMGPWYAGLTLSRTSFPSGNIAGSSVGFVLGYADGFKSYQPDESGQLIRGYRRSGLGFDEFAFSAGPYQPRKGSFGRSGVKSQRMGKVGGALRQYVSEGAWWGIEAAGASQGGADGYMEALVGIGQDYALGIPTLRAGWQAAAGLGGGGDVDTGNGWLVKLGPTLRWKSPWGPSLLLDAGFMGSISGQFKSSYARLSLGLPLDQAVTPFGEPNATGGVVQTQTVAASLQHLSKVRFKDGREESVGHLAMVLTRELSPHVYGVAQAGSAAFGSAGAYSFGLVGLGLQTRPMALQGLSGLRLGAELMVGAGGGGGVAVSGGAIMQGEAWAEWSFGEARRLRLRTGVGQWRSLRGQTQSSPMVNVSLGYAFGTLQR